MLAILGKKLGMTQTIDKEGAMICVTVVEAGPCTVVQAKEIVSHGYKAVQIGFGKANEKRLPKALKGHFDKNKLASKRWLREIPLGPEEKYEVGQEIKADIFKAGDLVDVRSRSIGKGFAGGMKRWHWKGGPETHGSMTHRRIGSVGSTTFPGRTLRGQHMSGHLGDVFRTVQNIEVIKVDAANNLLVLKGSVPGKPETLLYIRKSLKRPEGVKAKIAQKTSEKKDPLKASKKAAAGKAPAKK